MPRKKAKKEYFKPIKVEKLEYFEGSPKRIKLSKTNSDFSPNYPTIDLCSSPEIVREEQNSGPIFALDSSSPTCSPLYMSTDSSEIEFQQVVETRASAKRREEIRKDSTDSEPPDIPCFDLTENNRSATKKDPKNDSEKKSVKIDYEKKEIVPVREKRQPRPPLAVPKEKPKFLAVEAERDKKPKNKPQEDVSKEIQQNIPKTAQITPLPSTSGLPKFNIVHADKSKKLQPARAVKRYRSPSPLKFEIVLQNGNQPRKRGPRGPRKSRAKPIMQDATTQTMNGKILPEADLSCETCKKRFTDQKVRIDEQSIRNAYLEACLKVWKEKEKALKEEEEKAKKEAILPKKTVGNPMKVIKEVTRMSAPSHKVPTTGVKIASKVTEEVNADVALDVNLNPEPMDVEEAPKVPKITFTWDAEKPSKPIFRTAHYTNDDLMDVNRNAPSLIPQGAFKSKPITKKDDVARIGKFNELYDNPNRPKLLEVEHPPEKEDAQSLVKSNVAFFAEPEPEHLIDPELAEIFADISDDEDDENHEIEAKFSDDEDDETTDDVMDTFESPQNESMISSEHSITEDALLENIDFDMMMFDRDAIDPLEAEMPQEPTPVEASKRIEQEIEKTKTKTLLEIVNDDELDFDDEFDEDDIESPAYEVITNAKSPEITESEVEMEKTEPIKANSSKKISVDSGCSVSPDPEASPMDTSGSETPISSNEDRNNEDSNENSPCFDVETIVNDIEKLKSTLKTCTNDDLTEIYGICVTDREFFISHFDLIAKEMGNRGMMDHIMRALRVCETYEAFSHYKIIIEALILAGFQTKVAVKYITTNSINTSEAFEIVFNIIFERDFVDDSLDYFKKSIKHLKNTSLERLLEHTIKTESRNDEWKRLVQDILANRTLRQTLYGNPQLREKVMAWLGDGKKEEIKEISTSEVKPEVKICSIPWQRTIINNRCVNNGTTTTKALPPLLPINGTKK